MSQMVFKKTEMSKAGGGPMLWTDKYVWLGIKIPLLGSVEGTEERLRQL